MINFIEFELLVYEMIPEGIDNIEDLQTFTYDLHQHLEIAVEDYARDVGIEDYIPTY
jgi:hypothetical protein